MAKKLFYALPLVFICGGALCQLALAARDFGVADSRKPEWPRDLPGLPDFAGNEAERQKHDQDHHDDHNNHQQRVSAQPQQFGQWQNGPTANLSGAVAAAGFAAVPGFVTLPGAAAAPATAYVPATAAVPGAANVPATTTVPASGAANVPATANVPGAAAIPASGAESAPVAANIPVAATVPVAGPVPASGEANIPAAATAPSSGATNGTKDAPASGTKDAPASGTKDDPASGTKDAPASGTKDAPVTGTQDPTAGGNVALNKRSNANYHIYDNANFPDGRTQRGSHPGYPNVQNLYCMCPLEGKSSDSEFFKQYGWIAAGPETGIQCGECIKIRNVLNVKTIVARRMDEKGEGRFDFDYERTFKPLDSGDVNFKRGNMDFDWAKVPC
ncbi:hypothetical protein OEZ86_007546 [Tetradesmus obliquus]|nr:hypothetical protein OEZ86_007546 [Tetradesmus obliquus]